MLAAKADLSKLVYPLLASYKIDGVRALVKDGVLLSRTLKPIPNLRCQTLLAKSEFEGYDGELLSGKPTDPASYRNTVSQVMTIDASTQDLQWLVFDRHNMPGEVYSTRYTSISFMRLEHTTIYGERDLISLEEKALGLGYEGLILRGISSTYKFGRSTVLQGGMLKLKRFLDDEAQVIGFEELEHNANPAEKNELGFTKHSHRQEGKVLMDTLGALLVNWRGLALRIGTGFTQQERSIIWNNKEDYIGKLVKFKYFPIGMKDLPRHPIFLGWRDSSDV